MTGPSFVRLEYLTPAGWAVGHGSLTLADPQAYVDGLARRGVPARCVEVALASTDATGVVWGQGEATPEPVGVPLAALSRAGVTECSACGGAHRREWECVL